MTSVTPRSQADAAPAKYHRTNPAPAHLEDIFRVDRTRETLDEAESTLIEIDGETFPKESNQRGLVTIWGWLSRTHHDSKRGRCWAYQRARGAQSGKPPGLVLTAA